jgi:beta-lactamase class D
MFFGREMKAIQILAIAATLSAAPFGCGQTFPIPDSVVSNAFAGRRGAFVVIDCSSEAVSDFRRDTSSEKLAPCSTFKIWNTLIGLESGLITSAGEAFYRWDGKTRAIPEWNQDLTLKKAFQASCVPAFQNLAREIGPKRMQSWLDRIGYGDRDLSAGIEVFWLPATGRKTLLITPLAQAQLMSKLVSGKLPFAEQSRAVLKDAMTIRKTSRGSLYGKTGSSVDDAGKYVMGWFVGYVANNGKIYAFACTAKSDNVMGKDARVIVEAVLEQRGLL